MAILVFNVPARTMKRERFALAGVPLLTSCHALTSSHSSARLTLRIQVALVTQPAVWAVRVTPAPSTSTGHPHTHRPAPGVGETEGAAEGGTTSQGGPSHALVSVALPC